MPTVEEYKQKIAALKEQAAAQRKRIKELEKESESATSAFSNAETLKRTLEFERHNLNNNKWWIIFAGLALLAVLTAVVLSFFQMRHPDIVTFWQGFKFNGVPTILMILCAIAIVFSIVFFLVKKKNTAEVLRKIASANDQYDACKAASDAETAKIEDAKKVLRDLEDEAADTEKKLYLDHPDEAEKEKARKAQEKQKAIDELRRIDEFNRKAEEDDRKRQENLILAQKMFDHPQAYILDGLYENEYETFKASAELGCEDAQIKVCEILLGISYKKGVEPDPARGEELSLRYAEAGNNALYEILGKGFLKGEGKMEKDEAKGLKYLEKASAKGRQQAMIMAAICHYNGVGTVKDEARARYFFDKAAKQGNEQAIRVVASIDNGEHLKF